MKARELEGNKESIGKEGKKGRRKEVPVVIKVSGSGTIKQRGAVMESFIKTAGVQELKFPHVEAQIIN